MKKRIYFTYTSRPEDGGYFDFDMNASLQDIVDRIGTNAVIYKLVIVGC